MKDLERGINRAKPGADPIRQVRGHEFGLKSAARFSSEQHSLRSSERGNITLQRYGLDYYTALGRLSAARARERQQGNG